VSAQPLRALLTEAFAAEPTRIQYVGGGCINQALRVEVGDARYFVKWKNETPPSFFEIEARGLELLRQTGAIRVPRVFGYRDDSQPGYLILEWIEESRRAESLSFAVNFGRALAQLHRVTRASYGLDHDNFIGELPQSNRPTARWIDFYRDQRLTPQMVIARQRRRLNPERESMLLKLMEALDSLIGDVPGVPSLLHGDLWSGNFLVTAGNQPVIVDPAVYYGDREVEIAFTELFGGFPPGFLAAYEEAYPLERGYAYRRPLYQLYPMLVHLNLFGESYGHQVDAICRAYLTR
jgi:fructosamine-3-kinase